MDKDKLQSIRDVIDVMNINDKNDGIINKVLSLVSPAVFGTTVHNVYENVFKESSIPFVDLSEIELDRIIKRGLAAHTLLTGDAYSANCWRRLESYLPDYLASSDNGDTKLQTRAIAVNVLSIVREMLLITMYAGTEASKVFQQKVKGTNSEE